MASLTRSFRRFAVALSGGAARCAVPASSSSSSVFHHGPLRALAARRPGLVASPAANPRDVALASRFSSAVAAARASDGQAVKTRLVQLLEKEIEHERGVDSQDEEKEISGFLDTSGWKLDNKEGHDQVTLTKDFNNEKITVVFSLSEVNRQEDHYDDELEQEIDEEIEEGENGRSPTVFAIVNCEKPGSGVLAFEVTLEDGDAIIQGAAHYPSADIAKMEDIEAEWKRRGLYGGPMFSELEGDLQDSFREYIEERGINTELANFITKYITFGEQKEYVNWLKLVTDHVKA